MKIKNLHKFLALSIAVLLMFSILAGCGSQQASQSKNQGESNAGEASGDKIVIGVYEPMTGASAAGGQMTVEGIELAKEMFPEVLGKRVELSIQDNKTDKTEAANAVSRLIERDKVQVIIGSYGSSLSMAGGQVAKDMGVPVIGCSPTNPLVTLNNDYYFRVCFIDPFQGTVKIGRAHV